MANETGYRESPGLELTFHPFTIGRGIREDGMDTGWRSLPSPLIEIPSGGRWELWLEKRCTPVMLADGEVMVIPAGVKHRLHCQAKVKMETHFLLGAFRWMAHLDLISMANIPIALPGDVGAKLLPLLDEMAVTWGNGCQFASDAVCLHKLAFEVMDIVMTYAGCNELHRGDHDMERISKALETMLAKPAEPHSCRALALKCGLSPSRFNAVFKEVLGVAPKVYLRDLRLRCASALLLSGDLLIYEIASECGFGSSGYFCRFFTKHIGMSPVAFRHEFKTRITPTGRC